MALIEVEHLVKEFKSIKKSSGVKGAVKDLFVKNTTLLRAVDDISFSIEQGEIVGYIGPNGAGKSTTIKMMSGILVPTSGSVRIGGVSPHENRKQVVRDLGVVFGQRSQLYWDLRLGESFELLKRIYRIDDRIFTENLDRMNQILHIDEIIDKPVRQLSLGQRMRGDLAAAMLHSPPILFLDEPTIGLDVEAKHAIRKFIQDINRQYDTTIILTTHDLDDIQELCSRVIVINSGKIIAEGSLHQLADQIAPFRYLIVDFYEEVSSVTVQDAEVVKQEGARVWLRFEKSVSAAALMEHLCNCYKISDFSLEEPEIEDIIRQVYKNGAEQTEVTELSKAL